MAVSTATITGKTGAGLTMTAQVFNSVREFTLDVMSEILTLTSTSGVVTKIAVGAQTTFTVVVNSTTRVYTITVS